MWIIHAINAAWGKFACWQFQMAAKGSYLRNKLNLMHRNPRNVSSVNYAQHARVYRPLCDCFTPKDTEVSIEAKDIVSVSPSVSGEALFKKQIVFCIFSICHFVWVEMRIPDTTILFEPIAQICCGLR